LTEEEITEKYDGKLKPVMTMAMDSLIATVFKVLAQSKVLITRHFKSATDFDCIKCSLKQNDGLLYPFEKSIIFIHKPTVIIRYSDVETVEYGRYKIDKHAATKNFDLKITLKPHLQAVYGDVKEFEFSGIERTEFANIHTFLKSKKMNVEEVEIASKSLVDELGEEIPEDEDEEDDDYNSDNVSQSSGGSGSGSDSDPYASSDDEGDSKKKKSKSDSKKRKVKDKSSAKKSKSKGKSKVAEEPPKKKKKDPNAPKGAMSAYILFGNDERAKIKEDLPDATTSEVMKEIGARWRAMSAEDKAPFEEKAAEDKTRATDELAAYKKKRADAGEESEGDMPKKRAKKDPNAPKGAMTSYILFGNEERAKIKEENPDASATDIMKEIGVRWRSMSAEDKAPFEAKSAEDKVRAKAEMAAYKASKKTEEAESDDGSENSDDDSDGGSMSEDDN
jgi:structure-specific recognition protein 1